MMHNEKIIFFLIFFLVFISSVSASVERTASTDTYCNDRICTKTLYSGTMNYWDGNSYEPIETNLVSSSDPLYDYEVTKGVYSAYFKSDPTEGQVVKYVKDGVEMTFQPMALNYRNDLNQLQQIEMINSVTGTSNSNEFLYENAYGSGIDLKYTYYQEVLKEGLIIESFSDLTAPQQYIIDGGNPTLDLDFIIASDTKIIIDGVEWDKSSSKLTSNEVYIKDTSGNIIYYLPKPYAYDSDGNQKLLSYQFKKGGNSLYITLKTDYSWLQSAVYPIEIDPTIQLRDVDTENLGDTYIEDYDPSDTHGSITALSIEGHQNILSGSTFDSESYKKNVSTIMRDNEVFYGAGIKLQNISIYISDCLDTTTLYGCLWDKNDIEVGCGSGVPCSTGYVSMKPLISYNCISYTNHCKPGIKSDGKNFTISVDSDGESTDYYWNTSGTLDSILDVGIRDLAYKYQEGRSISFLVFDISSIPDTNTNITNASLYLQTSGTGGVKVYNTSGTWNEDTLNWNNKPPNYNFLDISTSSGLKTFNVINAINTDENNISFMLNMSTSVKISLYSKENSDTLLRPYLNVTYKYNIPEILLIKPANDTTFLFKDKPYLFNFTINDSTYNINNVTLYINHSDIWGKNITNLSLLNVGDNTYNNFTINITRGHYVWDIEVCNNQGSCNFARENRSLTITNSLPIVASATINDTSPNDNRNIQCINGSVSDLDTEDTITLHYDWYNSSDGTNFKSLGVNQQELYSSNYSTNDYLKCLIYPTDSYGESGNNKTSAIIQIGSSNKAPIIHYINLTTAETGLVSNTSNPTNNNSYVRVAVNWTDTEGDAVTIYACTTDSATTSGCNGGVWWNSTYNQTGNVTVFFNITKENLTTTTNNVYIFVADNYSGAGGRLLSSSKSDTFTVNFPPFGVNFSKTTSPNDGTSFAQTFVNLSWTASLSDPDSDTIKYNVYADTNTNPTTLRATVSDVRYDLTSLSSAKYYWKVETIDVHNYTTLSNSSIRSFTISVGGSTPPSGGGGSPTEEEILTCNQSGEIWDIKTLYGKFGYVFSLPFKTVKPVSKQITLTNYGDSNLSVELSCEKTDNNSINICNYVKIPNSTITVYPNPKEFRNIDMEVTFPEDAKTRETYTFNIVAESNYCKFKLNNKAYITRFSFTKWKEINLSKLNPEWEDIQYPVLVPAILAWLLVLIAGTVISKKKKNLFIGTFLIGIIFGGTAFIIVIFI